MTGYYCPVEGCAKHAENWDDEQPPFASREAVRSHINAMSDDDHQRARDEGVWKQAPEAGEVADDEGVADDDEQSDDQEESSNEQANEQPDEGGEQPLEEEDMVNPEEYEQQQAGETEGQDGGDEQPESSDEQAIGGELTPSKSLLPDVPPMTAFAIIAAIFAAIVIWRVMRARSSKRHQALEQPDEEEEQQTTNNPLLEQ